MVTGVMAYNGVWGDNDWWTATDIDKSILSDSLMIDTRATCSIPLQLTLYYI